MCLYIKNQYASIKACVQRKLKKTRTQPAASGHGSLPMSISSPFGFKHENTHIPGLDSHELQVLREQAAASRVGVAEDMVGPRPIPTKKSARAGVTEATDGKSTMGSTTITSVARPRPFSSPEKSKASHLSVPTAGKLTASKSTNMF